jgi:hypothetical protein
MCEVSLREQGSMPSHRALFPSHPAPVAEGAAVHRGAVGGGARGVPQARVRRRRGGGGTLPSLPGGLPHGAAGANKLLSRVPSHVHPFVGTVRAGPRLPHMPHQVCAFPASRPIPDLLVLLYDLMGLYAGAND